ncbi:hypothetical protein I7I51_03029 [Histoplasma capsulatum]|uniref:Protein kinase domain-containing protein n=1 Tax=Ajellomyces capsulatus TaxID=5037 RepID=A0A8A1MRY8_AJECA|nr:predicted protein [Histoplasma mississippiense (nom. inval.)]EDN11266.1 predicted protein [Histoplasma mississippiense (nom. inval.)]QSS66817.1 hypothetical protein I7I51_03029 [Histoplasma capsulatum]
MTPNESSEATPHPDPPYDIVNFWCGDKDKTEMTVMCYDRRFDILALAKNMEECPAIKSEFFGLIKDLLSMDNDDFQFKPGQPDPMEEMCYWMAKACFAHFRTLAPRPTEPRIITLEEYYTTPAIHLTITVNDGKLTAIQSSHKPDDLMPRTRLSSSYTAMTASVPLLKPSKVKLPWDSEHERPLRPSRVLVGNEGKEQFFKPAYRELLKHTEREIKTLLRLHQLGLSDKIRVPKIHGFVSSGNKSNMEICGILITYIKFRRTLASRDEIRKAAPYLRETWIHQLKEMVNEFHKAGIIWGDVKPGNVLIDMENNLWIIDFGGSYTPGWVEEKLMETVEGDLQGLSKIINFINGREIETE